MFKLYDNKVMFLLKQGAKIRMLEWHYEDSAYVTLEEFYGSFYFYINREFPLPKKEIFVISYSALISDWIFYE